MKKKCQSVALVSLGIGLLCVAATFSFAFESTGFDSALEAILRSHPTPEAVAHFLRQNITSAEDSRLFGRAEYWQTPEEMLLRRKGDCEDYAILTQALLERLGFEAFVFSLYGERGYAHTVTVFKEKGHHHVINQDRLIRLKARTLEEVASWMYPDWTWGAVVTQRGHQGRIVREIFKTSVEAQLVASSLIERSA